MRYAAKTLEKIEKYKSMGFEIVENKNWRFGETNTHKYFKIVKLAQTNDCQSGYPKRIIWAVKKSIDYSKICRNIKSLSWAFDNVTKIEGFEDYLMSSFFLSTLDLGSIKESDKLVNGELDFFGAPYWVLENLVGHVNDKFDCDYIDVDRVQCEYMSGIWEPCKYGDCVKLGRNKFIYVGTVGLSEEMEEQAKDGECACYYIGSHFLRILYPWNERAKIIKK